jgi:hypothetical protein
MPTPKCEWPSECDYRVLVCYFNLHISSLASQFD